MVARTQPPEGAADPGLWAGERFGVLTYRIPAPAGSYTVNLYMAERWLGPGLPGGGGAGSRLSTFCVTALLSIATSICSNVQADRTARSYTRCVV